MLADGLKLDALFNQSLCGNQPPLGYIAVKADAQFFPENLRNGAFADIKMTGNLRQRDFLGEMLLHISHDLIQKLRLFCLRQGGTAIKKGPAWQAAKKEVKGGAMAIFPVLDGELVVGAGADILKQKRHMQIPYMAGSTSEDVMPPMIYQMAKDWCAAQEKNSYAWFFDRRLPGDDNGAWHSSDLWYWFGTLPNCWRPMEEKDYDLSRQMVDYLTNFCKYGDPNGAGLTAWIPAGKKVLRLGEEATHMGNASMTKLIKTMVTNKAVGE